MIIKCFENVCNSVKDAAGAAGKSVLKGYIWCGRRVEDLTKKVGLPETVAKVISSAIWALPYTALALALPDNFHQGVGFLALSLWQFAGKEIDDTMTKEHRQYAYIGLRNSSIIRVRIESATMAITGNWFMLLPIIFNLGLALQSHAVSNQETPENSLFQTPEEQKAT